MSGPKLYLLSNPTDTAGEATVLANILEMLPDIIVHLRKPGATILQAEQVLKNIPEEFHPRIVVHYFPRLLELFELKGWHYSPKFPHMPENTAISRSVHSLEELRRYEPHHDYLFCSPVFDSISKPGHSGKAWNMLEETPELRQKAVALGGITAQTVPVAKKMGFHRFAVLGHVWQSENPARTAATMSKLLENED